jgi:filamentous hemagglutinin
MGATFVVNIPSIDVHGVGRVVGVERFILAPGDGCLVTTTISHEVNHITSVRTGTEVLNTTPGHPFYSPSRGAWIDAGRLNEGDSVVQRDGTEQLVLHRRTTEVARTTVYNFEVEDSHTYFVGEGGIWVHNYPDPPPKAGAAAKGGMLGERGTQVSSKTVWKGDGARIDVENPNPGQRAGQIHFQQGKEKYLYDPATKSFPDAPKAVNGLLKDSGFQKGIEKAMKILGEL